MKSPAATSAAGDAFGRAAVLHCGDGACATSHHWGGIAQSHGHEVRLVPFEDRCATASALHYPGHRSRPAGAVAAFTPDLDIFDSGRSFAAWLGPAPRQRSTGGKTTLGSISKMGQIDIRLRIVGAMHMIRQVIRKGGSTNRWFAAPEPRSSR
ncbi:transposase [Paracoccus onchidii]|uniref:transposase n=1 Tax=Paracoccus onchidii TaxID=3017813 RepID=UPI0038CD3D83